MGTVYLARQVSLDRQVALKVLNPQLAQDPVFMARFSREARTAAGLVHHHIVQIYDIGSDRGLPYFSMEYVDGPSLADLLRRQGALEVTAAVGYVLQAARGLQFAHERGVIHRDVKPDNLLLNRQGIIKVADLGLVKMAAGTADPAAVPAARPAGYTADLAARDSVATLATAALGTPAYMAPEQARDAATVDARADVYALGCTLYALVTGQPPFAGASALEALTRHAHEPIAPSEELARWVHPTLAAVILRMAAKKPDERYADMGAVIEALESFLASQGAGAFTPREEHAATLTDCVRHFNAAPTVALRSWLILGFFGGGALLVVLCALLQRWLLAGSFLGLAVLTPLAYFLIEGWARRTYLFGKVRELVLSSPLVDWLIALLGALLFVSVLVLCGLFGVGVVLCLLAACLAAGLHFLVDHQAQAEQQEALEQAEELLGALRLRGLAEDALREFVCTHGGEHGEAFYEALFGYEAKLTARQRWGPGLAGRPRPPFGAWRDPLVRWIDRRLRARRVARERVQPRAATPAGPAAPPVAVPVARTPARAEAEVPVQRPAEAEVPAAPPSLPPALPRAPQPAAATAHELPSVDELLGLDERPEPPPINGR